MGEGDGDGLGEPEPWPPEVGEGDGDGLALPEVDELLGLDEPLVPLDPLELLGSGPDSSWRRRSARSRRSVTVCWASSMSSAGIASRTLSA